jgi:hypothetical protein
MRKAVRLSFKAPWTAAAIAVAVALYAAAINNALYELTSPSSLSYHVWLRKAYSIVAFTLVGYLFRRSAHERGGTHQIAVAILGTALYSAAIEVGQFLAGSKEGLGWNAIDTICGAIGGALACADLISRRFKTRRTQQRTGR